MLIFEVDPSTAPRCPWHWKAASWHEFFAKCAPNVIDTKLIIDELMKDPMAAQMFQKFHGKFTPSIANIIKFLYGFNISKACQGNGRYWDVRLDFLFRRNNTMSEQQRFYTIFDGICHLWIGLWLLVSHLLDNYFAYNQGKPDAELHPV